MKEQELLAQAIRETIATGKPVDETLTTDERVLARITDGIYRQPASALRELISNAYDADAKEVVIVTDAPRFETISIRDDGQGLSPEVLARLVKSIGGSSKRTAEGVANHVTGADPTRSPGGRQLIGKMGIGLFSVAQFTRHFLIITKQAGDAFRTIADITLGHDGQITSATDAVKQSEISTGHARIYQEVATDLESHGTEVKLLDLLPRTKDELASLDLWSRIDFEAQDDGPKLTEKPHFHIGRMKSRQSDELIVQPQLPWLDKDTPERRFEKLVLSVRELASTDVELVDLDKVCDKYLQTIWTLACSVPVDYLDGHPFDLCGEDDVKFFRLENTAHTQSKFLDLGKDQTPRGALALRSPALPPGDHFTVEVDGVKLFRPLLFRNQPKTSTAVKTPMLFVGKDRQEFLNKPVELSGGPLEFEAYLFWTPKVLPKQHQGVVLRVGNSSGAPFDKTFLGYQVSEQTRLRQITAEIFVTQGLDEAINLDRESFNYAHPHYQYLVKWLHNAIRQLTNKHKEVGKGIRELNLREAGARHREALEQRVIAMLKERGDEDAVEVIFLDTKNKSEATAKRKEGAVVLLREAALPDSGGSRRTNSKGERDATLEKRAIALTQVLYSWGALENLTYEEQSKLIHDILVITTSGSE